ncbi:MAG: alpha/beta hydrolase [Gaiellaceae bacterium]
MIVTVPDPDRRLRRVRLVQELWRPRLGPDFERAGDNGAWHLHFTPPSIGRIEYQLELTDADGRVELACDPGNPLRAPGPFGEKSVLELPGYGPPVWLAANAPAGRTRTVEVPSRTLGVDVPVTVWSPKGTRTRKPLPLLVAHDGPEYAQYSGLLRYLAAACAAGELPPLRAALVPPVERNGDYSSSARYARALAREILPRLEPEASTEGGAHGRAGMGTSLGALAMLHAHRTYPDAFGGLFLQSGSFFRQRYDSHERDFPHFRRISRFVGRVLTGDSGGAPIPVAMTCGTAEENLANNRAVAAALAAQGYDVSLDLVRDAHNWVAWRDAFEPHLRAFLRRLWA